MSSFLRKRSSMVFMLLYILIITILINVMGGMIQRLLSRYALGPMMTRGIALTLYGLQTLLVSSFSMILALLYAARRITFCNSLILFILFILFPVGWIYPVQQIVKLLIFRVLYSFDTVSIRMLFYDSLRHMVTTHGNLFFFTHWAYVKLVIGYLGAMGLAALARRLFPQVKPWIKRILFGAACGLLCLLIVLNSTGVLKTWEESLGQTEWMLNQNIRVGSNIDQGRELGNYDIRFGIRGIFDYMSEFMRYVRLGSSWPVTGFTILLLVICCMYCAGAASFKTTVQALAFVTAIGGLTMLLTPVSNDLQEIWSHSMMIGFGAAPPLKLLELAWYILQPVALLAIALLVRGKKHPAAGSLETSIDT